MLTPYQMMLDFKSQALRIDSGDITVQIRAKSVQTPIQHRKVKTSARTVVPPNARCSVPITFKPFSHDKDCHERGY